MRDLSDSITLLDNTRPRSNLPVSIPCQYVTFTWITKASSPANLQSVVTLAMAAFLLPSAAQTHTMRYHTLVSPYILFHTLALQCLQCLLSPSAASERRVCSNQKVTRWRFILYCKNLCTEVLHTIALVNWCTGNLYYQLDHLAPGLHKLWYVLISWADRGSCAHKCVC